jgi:hypothetical protein
MQHQFTILVVYAVPTTVEAFVYSGTSQLPFFLCEEGSEVLLVLLLYVWFLFHASFYFFPQYK